MGEGRGGGEGGREQGESMGEREVGSKGRAWGRGR